MKHKKKKVEIEKYWERRLGLKYSEELEYYNRLCGKEYNHDMLRKNSKYNIDSNFSAYKQWRNYILTSIENVDLHELEEYSKFLNQQVRDNENMFTLSQTILIPFIVCLVSNVFSFAFGVYVNSNTFKSLLNIILFPVCFVTFLWFILYAFKATIIPTKSAISCKYFYQDIKEIVDERIEELRGNKKIVSKQ